MPVKVGGATDKASRIEHLVVSQERRFREAFRLAIANIHDYTTLTSLANLLEQGRLEEALLSLRAAGEVLGGQAGASVIAAGEDAAKWLSTALTVTVAFDVTNIRAVSLMTQNRLRLIREFDAEAQRAVRTALVEGIERGLNPRDQARLFRASIGLTERQVGAVNNYRRLLEQGEIPSREALNRALRDRRFDSSVTRAIQNHRPLSTSQVDNMVNRYRQRFVAHRANTIARTEALRTVHQGTDEMYRQAIDSGQVDQGKLRRTWNTSVDGRERDSHHQLNGKIQGIDEAFEGLDGNLMYPGDPSAPASETILCRCVLSTRIDP